MESLKISARTLGQMRMKDFCLGCYWIELHCRAFPFQIPMPGIFSSIDAYTKKVIHATFDKDKRLPNCLQDIGNVEGYVDRLHYSWYKHEDREIGITLTGTPDDIFRLRDGSYYIVDYKTARVTKTQDELFPLYDVQLNAYAYIAEHLSLNIENFGGNKIFRRLKVSGACLVYFEPQTHIEEGELLGLAYEKGFDMRFKAKVKSVKLHPDHLIPPLLSKARMLYDLEQAPEHIAGCRNQNLLNQLFSIGGGQ